MKAVEVIKLATKELKNYTDHKKGASRSSRKADKTKNRILKLLTDLPNNEAKLYKEKIDAILNKL